MSHNVPVQSLIDHIKTAIDVDPWAKEMIENLLKEQEAVVRCKDCKHGRLYAPNCVDCEHIKMAIDADWFCADGERRTDDA